MLKPASLVRWTGKGKVEELRSTVESVARRNRVRGRILTLGDTVVVEGSRPTDVAVLFEHTPGVAWVAAGLGFSSMKEAGSTAGLIARKYLKRKGRFSVEGEGTGGAVGADVAGAATSGILDAVGGSRFSESAGVRFRAVCDGGEGVVAVEVAKGPGGASTGGRWASCLVSGGTHSSVVAWFALLNGYRVRLAHVSTTERALHAVAKLYAELTRRVGADALKLEVLEGGTTRSLFGRSEGGEAFGGFTSAGASVPRALSRTVTAPLYIMPEEQFADEFESLGVRADDDEPRWDWRPGGEPKVRKFEGFAEDVSAVLDGLR